MHHLTLKLVTSAHILFAALFVGSNVFMDFMLMSRLELIPPGQAARLGEKLGKDFAIFNWVCLIGLLFTGVGLAWKMGFAHSLFSPTFLTTSYGSALLIKEIIWGSLVVTGALMTFYLRPRIIVKLPYDASRGTVDASRESTLRYANWMRWLARYNALAGMTALVSAAFLANGGLWK